MGESGEGGNEGKQRAAGCLQVLLRARPHPTVEHRAAYWRVRSVERIHGRLGFLEHPENKNNGEGTDLEIQLPQVVEEHLDPVVVLGLVQEDKLDIYFP